MSLIRDCALHDTLPCIDNFLNFLRCEIKVAQAIIEQQQNESTAFLKVSFPLERERGQY
jgi:hypothetical protein